MSASLVGSEMCIRDSHLPSPHHSQGSLPLPLCTDLIATAMVRAEDHGPVSYTHLTLPTICSV
eukprot:7859661-Alexandrium_andersonii.AAC.1